MEWQYTGAARSHKVVIENRCYFRAIYKWKSATTTLLLPQNVSRVDEVRFQIPSTSRVQSDNLPFGTLASYRDSEKIYV